MKRFLLLFTVFLSSFSYAQILEPVDWVFYSKKISDNEFELSFIAHIDEHWAVYSQFVDDGGPLPTTFTFEENTDFELVDNVVELFAALHLIVVLLVLLTFHCFNSIKLM